MAHEQKTAHGQKIFTYDCTKSDLYNIISDFMKFRGSFFNISATI